MKQKEILNAIRSRIDNELGTLSFKFNSRQGGYIKFDTASSLYFSINILFMDIVARGTNHVSKYCEIYLNIYHSGVSKILLETSNRSFLESLFYFKIVGNMMSDIILNPEVAQYLNRNNHNYFKLTFVTGNDLQEKPLEMLRLIHDYAIPFFERLDSLEKIKMALDKPYEKYLSIHNANTERILALVTILFYLKDTTVDKKAKEADNYFLSIGNKEAVTELNRIIKLFS